jgi:predicted amidohydrolase YtcJ
LAGPAAQVEAPGNAVVMELAGMTLLPGLMDIHSHILALWEVRLVMKDGVIYKGAGIRD